MSAVESSPPSVADELSSFVAETDYESIPAAAISIACAAIADTVGVMLAGTRTGIGETIRRYVQAKGGASQASLYGAPSRVPAESAALANGTAAHALDFDDTSHPLHGHPSAVLVPALLACLPTRPLNGRDFLAAYLIGFEIESGLGRAMNLPHYRAGWHATGTFGTIGATAAIARLRRLPQPDVRTALGIAVSLASGARANFGSYTKPLHVGLAASNGVRAVELAELGWTSSPTALAGPAGFADLYGAGAAPNWSAMLERLGSQWTITEPFGLQLKPYPACGATHPAIDAALELREGLDLEQVQRVHVGTTSLLPQLLVHHDPSSSEQARFSLEYTLASAFTRGHVTLADFDPDALQAPDVRNFMRLIHQSVDPRVVDSTEFSAIVRVELRDGSVRECRVDLARGKNARPMTDAERLAKFHDCVGDAEPARRVWEGAAALPAIPAQAFEASIRELDAWLVSQG